jgi:Transposase IS116/IS110/IS902 family
LLSMQVIGVVQAATIIASIGNIANFPKACKLKAYFGWAPEVDTSGTSLNKIRLTTGGKRTMRKVMFLIVGNAIRMDCEWARLYERLVPKKCRYDEKTRTYRGKLKVMGRVAGQMIEMIYAFLKHDQEVLSKVPSGEKPPPPMLYDATTHQKHRKGEYQPLKRPQKRRKIIFLPPKE